MRGHVSDRLDKQTSGARRRELEGVGLAAASALAFGTMAIGAKLGYERGAQPTGLLAARFVVATILLVAFCLVTKRSLAAGHGNITRLLLLGGLGYAFEASLFFAALERAPAGVVALIFYSYPLWTNLIGWVTGLERFRPALVLALALGSGGVALIFSLPQGSLAGPLLALGAAVAVALYFVVAQLVLGDIDPAVAATWTAAGAALALSVAGTAASSALPAAALLPAAGLGLATVLAFIALYAAIARIGSARSAIAAMLEPVATVVLAAVVLGEDLTLRIAAGAALVVASLPVLVRRPNPPR